MQMSDLDFQFSGPLVTVVSENHITIGFPSPYTSIQRNKQHKQYMGYDKILILFSNIDQTNASNHI